MTIDPKEVQWDAAPKIDPAAVKWDAPKPSGILDTRGPAGVLEDWKNLSLGGLRGAARIGSTLLASPDELRARFSGAPDPRASGVQGGLAELGADPESLAFKAGDLGAQVAGTMGVGGGIAQGFRTLAPAVASKAAPLLSAIETAGMKAGGLAGVPGVAVRSAGGAVSGGAAAGLVDPKQAKTGAMIGGALPPALALAGKTGDAVGKTARAIVGKVEPEVVKLAQRAKQLGIDIPADRLVQSRPLDAVASGLNYVPFSGRAATEQRMTTQLNQALSRTFGQNDANVTAALRRADDALGQKFDSFLRGNAVKVDQQFVQDLAESVNTASKELSDDAASIIGKQVDDIIAKAGSGQIEGQAAYNIKRTLDRIGKRNTPEAWYALDLKQKLMDALNRSVGPQSAKGFAELRKQYGNMLELQKLAKNGVEGEISVARLANIKNIRNQDLQELADIAAQFVKAREGQHGAMQRAVVGVTSAALGGPWSLAGMAAAGRGANSLMNSQAARNALMGTQGGPQGALANELQQYLLRATPVAASSR